MMASNLVRESPPLQEEEEEVYTTFSLAIRRTITVLLGAATLASPLTATIYLPLLPLLSNQFGVSTQNINLTVTIYIVFQALAPLLLSTYSDTFGRRPVFLTSFTVYTFASLGLALNRSSFAGLLILRALQSLGASAVLSVCYGTVSDICVPSERGKVLGPVMAAANLGTAIGPVVGGWIALGSQSIWWAFWALVIFGALMLISLGILLPETARNVVGNGVVRDKMWNRSLADLLWRNSRECVSRDAAPPVRHVKFKSPLMSLRIMAHPDTALILWTTGSFYALWYTVQSSIPATYGRHPYNFDELQIGLAYLPGAAGVIICMYLTGKAMDYNYRLVAKRMGLTVDTVKGDDITNFPIERARTRGCLWLLLVSLAMTVSYGWAIQETVPVAVPLIFQFFMGFLATWILNCLNALLVDGFPDMPSTAATAGNIVRCAMSAGAVAAMQPLFDAIGKGWFFTLMGVLSGVGGIIAVYALNAKGMSWRQARFQKRLQHSGVRSVQSLRDDTGHVPEGRRESCSPAKT